MACVGWRGWHYFRSVPKGQLWSTGNTRYIREAMVWLWVSQREVKTAREDFGTLVAPLQGLVRHRMWPTWLRDQWEYGENPEHELASEYVHFFWSCRQLGHLWTCVLPFRRSVVQKEKKQLVESDIGLICSGGTGTQNILWSLYSILLSSFTLLTRKSPANSGSSSRF